MTKRHDQGVEALANLKGCSRRGVVRQGWRARRCLGKKKRKKPRRTGGKIHFGLGGRSVLDRGNGGREVEWLETAERAGEIIMYHR